MSGIGDLGKTDNYSVSKDGIIQFASGEKADLKTRAGVADAEAKLDVTGFVELKALMSAQGYRFASTGFVPDDKFGTKVDTSAVKGPQDGQAGRGELEADVSKAFTVAGIPDPYNANTTPKLVERFEQDPKALASLRSAVLATQSYLTNPTPQNLQTAAVANDGVTKGKVGFAGVNTMEVLYLVFRESIRQTNEDKKYFLKKLQDYNKMSEALSKYLQELVKTSQRLSEASRGTEEPQKVTIDVEVRSYDLSTLDSAGQLIQTNQVIKDANALSVMKTSSGEIVQIKSEGLANPQGNATDTNGRSYPVSSLQEVDPEPGMQFMKTSTGQIVMVESYQLANANPNAMINDMSRSTTSQQYQGWVTSHPQVRAGDLKELEKPTPLVIQSGETRYLDRSGLNDTIKGLETMQEDVRNRRQMASTAFQNFDQKSNQLMNLLSNVIKAMNEMRGIGASSRSGL